MMDWDILEYINRRHLDLNYINKKCRCTYDSIIVPVYKIDGLSWWQERYINPDKHNWVKSKTQLWTRGIYFLNWWDKNLDILIVEWEVDFLSIIPYSKWYNLMWLKGVWNLNTAIKEIEKLKKVYDVYILIDNDEAADKAIERVEYTELHLYDVRKALSWCKDVNDAICQWKLNMDFVPQRIIKEKKEVESKVKHNGSPYYKRKDYTYEEINIIPASEILERLYPEYEVCRDWTIKENGNKTNWYKYWREKNKIVDFSWKWRPSWNTYMIAKQKFGDAKTTFQYFKNLY